MISIIELILFHFGNIYIGKMVLILSKCPINFRELMSINKNQLKLKKWMKFEPNVGLFWRNSIYEDYCKLSHTDMN